MIAEVTREDLALHDLVHQTYAGIGYDALETADGMSVIVNIDAPTVEVLDDAPTRLRVRYAEAGGVRMLAGVYDSVLERNCQPTIQNGGTDVRCLVEPAGPEPRIYRAFTSNSCESEQVWLTTEAGVFGNLFRCTVPATGTYYERGAGHTCVPISAAYECLDASNELAKLSIVDD